MKTVFELGIAILFVGALTVCVSGLTIMATTAGARNLAQLGTIDSQLSVHAQRPAAPQRSPSRRVALSRH